MDSNGKKKFCRNAKTPFPSECNDSVFSRVRLGGTIDENFSDLRGSAVESDLMGVSCSLEIWPEEVIADDPTLKNGQRQKRCGQGVCDIYGHIVGIVSASQVQGLITNHFWPPFLTKKGGFVDISMIF